MSNSPSDSNQDFELLFQKRSEELKKANKLLLTEISERKHFAEEIRRSRDRLTNILESISDGFFSLDRNFIVTYFNKAAGNLLGRNPGDVLGRPLFEAFPEAKGSIFEEKYSEALTNHRFVSFETFFEVKPYENWYDVRVYPFEKGVSVFFQVITERKRLEEELLKAKKLESIGMLAGGIAHDFNNLLQGIILSLSLAKIKTKEEEVVKLLDRTEAQCVNAQSLTNMLLTFSKGGEPLKRTVAVGNILQELFASLPEKPGINTEINIPMEIYPAMLDDNQIKIALLQIIENSLESMPEGGTVSITAQNIDSPETDKIPLKAGRYIKISIQDSGNGIHEKNLDKVFDPYFSTKEFYSRKGMGLGLSIAYSIIRKHDGIITVESKVGSGATFNIYLPAP